MCDAAVTLNQLQAPPKRARRETELENTQVSAADLRPCGISYRLRCRTCTDVMYQPVVAPCGHGVCKFCARDKCATCGVVVDAWWLHRDVATFVDGNTENPFESVDERQMHRTRSGFAEVSTEVHAAGDMTLRCGATLPGFEVAELVRRVREHRDAKLAAATVATTATSVSSPPPSAATHEGWTELPSPFDVLVPRYLVFIFDKGQFQFNAVTGMPWLDVFTGGTHYVFIRNQ